MGRSGFGVEKLADLIPDKGGKTVEGVPESFADGNRLFHKGGDFCVKDFAFNGEEKSPFPDEKVPHIAGSDSDSKVLPRNFYSCSGT